MWQEEQDALCPGCRQPRVESFAKDGKEYRGVPLRCKACEARDLTAQHFTDPVDRAGLFVGVEEIERIYYDD